MLLTSVVSIPAPEQNIDIVDQILNDDGTPAEGAIVSLYKEGSYVRSYTTLADGIYEFRNLIKAIYEIQIVYSDGEQGIRWRDLGKITETFLAPGVTNFDIVTPTLILSSEDGVTTVSVDEPGTGYDPDDPPVIAADDGFTAIGIVNSLGILTGLNNISPGNGTATTVDTFNIRGISNLITYNGNQSQTGGESTDDFSGTFYTAINAMTANINWNIGTLAGRFSYFTSANLNISVGAEADAYAALNGKYGWNYPNYVDKGLYAYPVGTITYQANRNNFTPPNNAWAGGSYQGNGSTLSGTFIVYNYGLIDYSDFFETKNTWPPKAQSGQDPFYVYDLKIPTNHPNIIGPGGWIEQLYKPCGVKTSVYEFILGMQELNQASIDAKRYAANMPKSVANQDNLFKDILKVNWNNLKLLGSQYVNAVSLFNLLSPLIDDDIPILINNELAAAPSMSLNDPYYKLVYYNSFSRSDRAKFGTETAAIQEKVYKYLNNAGQPTSTNTGRINPFYDPSVSIQTFNEIKGYLGAKYLPQIAVETFPGYISTTWNQVHNLAQNIDSKLGTTFAQKWVITTSIIADFYHQAGQIATTGEISKNFSDFVQQSTGAASGTAPQYLWGKSFMTEATEQGYAWVHTWNQSNGAYTILKVAVD